MAKTTKQGVLSANDLITGAVVYLATDGKWIANLNDALLISDSDAEAEIEHWSKDISLVGVHLAPATAANNTIQPGHLRETFRNTGPSNYAHVFEGERHV